MQELGQNTQIKSEQDMKIDTACSSWVKRRKSLERDDNFPFGTTIISPGNIFTIKSRIRTEYFQKPLSVVCSTSLLMENFFQRNSAGPYQGTEVITWQRG